jgi:hypothetical protein
MRRRKQPLTFALGGIRRVEMPGDKPAGPVDNRTETQKLGDLYYADLLRREAADKAAEQRKIDAERAEQGRKQAEAARQRARGQFEMTEALIDDCLVRHKLTQAEKDAVTQDLLDNGYSIERCEMLCGELTARKQQAAQQRIAKLRDLCSDEEWTQIENIFTKNRQHFSDAEVASGEAYQLIWDRLNF